MTNENTATMDRWMEEAINEGNLRVVADLAPPGLRLPQPHRRAART